MNVMSEKIKENKEILEVIFNQGIQDSLTIEGKMTADFLDKLKEGNAVFTYTKKDDMFQVSIYNNIEWVSAVNDYLADPDDYSVSIITKEYTVAFKHVNLKYLKNQVYNKMKEAGIEKNILEDYKLMIKRIETKLEEKTEKE